MKHIYILFAVVIILLLGACISSPEISGVEPEPKTGEDTPVQPATPDPVDKSVVHDDNIIQRMAEYLENGKEKIDYGAIAEGIKQLISVLAEKGTLEGSSAEADELANEAEIELNRLRAALMLEPDPAWIDENLNQRTGSSVDIFPQPAVILTIDTGMGRSLVANAPVLFQFIKGSGTLTGFVNTSEYGQASCKILNLDNNMAENVVRASLVFKEKGYTYQFEGVTIDFGYAPPSKRATILVQEKSKLGIADDPVIFKTVYDKLQNVAFDFSLFNSYLDPDAFQRIYNGDLSSIRKLGLGEDVPYLVVVYNDVFTLRELEMDGVGLGLFISEARATVRIIRVSDGKILYQSTASREKAKNQNGQGGSAVVAAKNVIDLVSVDMADKLGKELDKINSALTGE